MSRKILPSVFFVVLLVSCGLLLAVAVNGIYVHEETSDAQLNEDVPQNYSLVVNISNDVAAGDNNITQVNITLPASFTYQAGENWTDAPVNSTQFVSNGQILSWTNGSGNGAGYLINGSKNGTYFSFNATAATAGDFNLTVWIVNSSNASEVPVEKNISVTINDTTTPVVATPTVPVTQVNYSGTIYFNVTVTDDTTVTKGGSVIFNITNSSGGRGNTTVVNMTALNETNQVGAYWSIAVNTALFPDGEYNISIWANDSNNRTNATVMVQHVRFDNTGPSSIVLTSRNATKNSLEVDIEITEALSGIGACTVDRTGATITAAGGGTSIGGVQVLEEASLSCGTTYAYTVTCLDSAGNSASSDATSFTTLTCSGGDPAPSGGGGSGTTSTWTHTYVATSSEFASGYTKELGVKNRIRVTVGTATHHVGVKSLTETSAVIEIASDPVEVNLDVGEEAKVDVDSDGVYDIYVKLNSIASGKADVFVQSISETVPSDATGGVSTTGDVVPEGGLPTDTEDEGSSTTWIWIVVILVIIVAIIGGVAYKKRQ